MISGIHTEVVMAAGYAVFLACVAIFLERVALHTHQRSKQYHTVGFVYQLQLDVWQCPAGQHLHRIGFDDQKRIARYRAPAKVCNSCSLKNNCTDSDEGRELEHHLDSWLQSELNRFHRGISLALLLLAGLIIVAEAVGRTAPTELALLFGAFTPIAIVGKRLVAEFLAR